MGAEYADTERKRWGLETISGIPLDLGARLISSTSTVPSLTSPMKKMVDEEGTVWTEEAPFLPCPEVR
jgi:hypothetical protein